MGLPQGGADHDITAGSRGWVGIKEPEDEGDGSGITGAQITYINSYGDAADKALFGTNFKDNANGWKKYIDINSAVDYYIGQELLKPVDGKQSAKTWFNRLNEDVDFRNTVKARWNNVYSSLRTNDAFLASRRSLIEKSANASSQKWNVKEHLSAAQVVKGSWSAEVT